jgi:hypothetical protein
MSEPVKMVVKRRQSRVTCMIVWSDTLRGCVAVAPLLHTTAQKRGCQPFTNNYANKSKYQDGRVLEILDMLVPSAFRSRLPFFRNHVYEASTGKFNKESDR